MMMIIMTTMRFVGLLTCINAAVLDPMQKNEVLCTKCVYHTVPYAAHMYTNICYTLIVCLLYAQTVTHGKAPQLYYYIHRIHTFTYFSSQSSIGIYRSLSLSLALLNASKNKHTHTRTSSLTHTMCGT